jgi:16S rRNA (cytidine1402-2'-O)-methyltransferase
MIDKEKQGSLFLIPSSIEQENTKEFLIENEKNEIHHITNFIVENEKVARASLKALNLKTKIQDVKLILHNKKNTLENIDQYFLPILNGEDIGLLSDSGNPCIADPGSIVVKRAHELNIRVNPLIGPSSVLLGLIASGFNGQKFKFHGYIPIKEGKRNKFIKDIEKSIKTEQETQIFIETPYRNNQLLVELIKRLNNDIKLCLAINLTSDNEKIISETIGKWRKRKIPDLNKQLCIFLVN